MMYFFFMISPFFYVIPDKDADPSSQQSLFFAPSQRPNFRHHMTAAADYPLFYRLTHLPVHFAMGEAI